MIEQKQQKAKASDIRRMQRTVESNHKHIKEIDRLIERIYEDNVNGKISDERFMTMSGNYEAEQKKLLAETEALEIELSEEAKNSTDLRLLLKTIRDRPT